MSQLPDFRPRPVAYPTCFQPQRHPAHCEATPEDQREMCYVTLNRLCRELVVEITSLEGLCLDLDGADAKELRHHLQHMRDAARKLKYLTSS